MRVKNRFVREKTRFICQITETHLKVAKCLLGKNLKREFIGLETEEIPPQIDDKKLAERVNKLFKKLEYSGSPVILSLPRSYATCRYLKVPTWVPQEIEKIANLQAAHYLPYPANELITGYQIIQTDKQGYSDINLIITHKDAIQRYIRMFGELKTGKLTIVLSSYGVSNLYSYINPQETDSAMVIDIDSHQVELAIISQNILLFSRSFKLSKSMPNWEKLFIDEIKKTQDTYKKDISKEIPHKVILLGPERILEDFAVTLNKEAHLSVQVMSYAEKINLSENLLNSVSALDYSFASIFGLGLVELPESLNLLPQDIKEITKKTSRHKEYLRLASFVLITVFIFGLAIVKNFDNKIKYLAKLKAELNKIAKEAEPLEEIDRRIKLLEDRSQKKLSSLNILYEIYQTIPSSVSLINLIYEEDGRITMRGQTPDLNSIFIFVAQLEKSPVFKNFDIEVNYATKKKIQAGEIVDFEIVCLKK